MIPDGTSQLSSAPIMFLVRYYEELDRSLEEVSYFSLGVIAPVLSAVFLADESTYAPNCAS